MIINQMISGQTDERSCAGHSTRRAQRTVLSIISPRIITGLCSDPRRGNLSPSSRCGARPVGAVRLASPEIPETDELINHMTLALEEPPKQSATDDESG